MLRRQWPSTKKNIQQSCKVDWHFQMHLMLHVFCSLVHVVKCLIFSVYNTVWIYNIWLVKWKKRSGRKWQTLHCWESNEAVTVTLQNPCKTEVWGKKYVNKGRESLNTFLTDSRKLFFHHGASVLDTARRLIGVATSIHSIYSLALRGGWCVILPVVTTQNTSSLSRVKI